MSPPPPPPIHDFDISTYKQQIKIHIQNNDYVSALTVLNQAITDLEKFMIDNGIVNDGISFNSQLHGSLKHTREHLQRASTSVPQKMAALRVIDERITTT